MGSRSRWDSNTSNRTWPDNSICFWTFESGVKLINENDYCSACATLQSLRTGFSMRFLCVIQTKHIENPSTPVQVSELFQRTMKTENEVNLGSFGISIGDAPGIWRHNFSTALIL